MENGSEPPKVVRQPTQQTQINDPAMYDQPEAQSKVGSETNENELTNEEYDVDEGNFEQHAHKPTLPRTQSALAVHLTEMQQDANED